VFVLSLRCKEHVHEEEGTTMAHRVASLAFLFAVLITGNLNLQSFSHKSCRFHFLSMNEISITLDFIHWWANPSSSPFFTFAFVFSHVPFLA
jgi:hypothetical protein